jgi:radical SAM protein with 4Fe4S-binding SPASM domain
MGDLAYVPHVVAWNITRRCNLACAHCYIAAGAWHSDADELSTDDCMRIVDQIIGVNPAPMLVLSGGEPLVRQDLEQIAAHATAAGATVVVGTNGTGLTAERIASSVDSLDPQYHDRFRHGAGALHDTLAAVERLRAARLDCVVQTTATRGNREEIGRLAEWAASAGAVAFNVYFLVSTGRGEGMKGLSPGGNDNLLAELLELERLYRGRMLVRSKCQPQIMRHAYEASADSPLLNYATRCPCGVHYCRITPEGSVTPCPYMPAVAGDLRETSFEEVWTKSSLFQLLRAGGLGGKCGRCEYREVCGGCRARAYAQDGDFLDEDRSCAYEPSGTAEPVQAGRAAMYGDTGHATELEWTVEASERIARVPSFVRGVVVRRIEDYARRQGESRVTADLMARVRSDMPVDFSRRLPFFVKDRVS